MSDKLKPSSMAGAGSPQAVSLVTEQPVTPVGEVKKTAGQEEAQPKYVTRAEAEALFSNILEQVRSYSDKGRVRAEKAIQELAQEIATFPQVGIPNSPLRDLPPKSQKAIDKQ